MRCPLLAAALVALAALAALALAACDAGTPTPTTKKPTPAPAAAGAEWTVTHILIATSDSPSPQHQGKVVRSKAVGKQVAQSLIAEIQAGRAFEDLVTKFTGDLDKDGKPNTNNGKLGSYTFGTGMMVPAFEQAAKDTPVGKVAPEPIETPYGYHIVRRDK